MSTDPGILPYAPFLSPHLLLHRQLQRISLIVMSGNREGTENFQPRMNADGHGFFARRERIALIPQMTD